jgi:hypothetical protein
MTCNCDFRGIRLQSIVELTHSPHGTRTCDLHIRGPSGQYLHDKYFMKTKSEPKNFKDNKFVLFTCLGTSYEAVYTSLSVSRNHSVSLEDVPGVQD